MADILPLAIGSTTWPGLGKLAEECGENVQVVAMLLAFPDGDRPDGSGVNVKQRLMDELGDLLAAIDYVIEANALDSGHISWRRQHKLETFRRWHAAERAEMAATGWERQK